MMMVSEVTLRTVSTVILLMTILRKIQQSWMKNLALMLIKAHVSELLVDDNHDAAVTGNHWQHLTGKAVCFNIVPVSLLLDNMGADHAQPRFCTLLGFSTSHPEHERLHATKHHSTQITGITSAFAHDSSYII